MNRSVRTGANWAACTVGFLLAPSLMNAQLDRSHPPVPGPAPEVLLGTHATQELPNGMRLIVVEDHKLPLVSVQVRFDVPPVVQGDKVGYMDLVGELLAAGAALRTKADIDHTIDELGATFFASSDGVYAGALKKNLDPLMGLLQDVVQAPTFPEEELEKLRVRYRSSVQQRSEDPEAIAEVVGRSVTFGGNHPYGEVMTLKTVGKIDRATVAAYHRYFFRPEKAYLVFVGDITEKEAQALAKAHFSKWKPAPSLVSTDAFGRTMVEGLGMLNILQKPVVASGMRRVFVVDRPGAAQSVIRVSFPLGLLPKDLRSQQAQVMNTLLGGGVFNARLMQNLREKRGFTYGANSTLDVDRFNSSFTAMTSVRTEVTDSAVTEILLEIDRMRNEPVTAEELELSKRSMMGSFGRSLEDPKTVARFALNTELNGLPSDHYRTYLSRLEGITVQQVQDAAAAFLYPEQAVVLVVGDMERIKSGLGPLSLESGTPVHQLTEDGQRWEEQIKPVRDRTAEQVIDAYITAIGGREAIAPLRNVHIERSVVGGYGTSTSTEWFAPDRYHRVTKKGGSTEEEVIFDGNRAILNSPEASGEITDAGLDAIRIEALPVPELGFDRTVENRVLLGTTTLRGKEAYKILMYTLSGSTFAVYFDVASGLKLRRSQELLVNGRSHVMNTDYADWRSVQGVLFPYSEIEEGGPSGKFTRTITSVEMNKPMPPTFFEVNIPEVPDAPVTPEFAPQNTSSPAEE